MRATLLTVNSWRAWGWSELCLRREEEFLQYLDTHEVKMMAASLNIMGIYPKRLSQFLKKIQKENCYHVQDNGIFIILNE